MPQRTPAHDITIRDTAIRDSQRRPPTGRDTRRGQTANRFAENPGIKSSRTGNGRAKMRGAGVFFLGLFWVALAALFISAPLSAQSANEKAAEGGQAAAVERGAGAEKAAASEKQAVREKETAKAEAAETEPLRKLNNSIQALIRKVSPSVVQILVNGYGALEEGEHGDAGVVIGRQRAIGSGFVIDPSGYIVTNAHVVRGAQSVQVFFPLASGDTRPSTELSQRGSMLAGRVVGVARDIDLAVIKVDAKNLPALPLANYSELMQGEMVFAFGSPEGLRDTVTMGVVSATARQTSPDSPMVYIQTDAPINPGNSGGPLINVNGEVVGVNTFILSQSGGNEGLGFAIPSVIVGLSYKQIRKLGHIHRVEMGVGIQSITPALATALQLPRDSGVIISDVEPGSTAEEAGLRIQDVVLSVDGKAAYSVPTFVFRLMSHEAGDKVHVEVLRKSEQLAFDVKVAEPEHQVDQMASLVDPEKSLVTPLGILGVEIDQQVAKQLDGLRDPFGVLVAARSAESSADVPLVTGDVIRTLNGVPMTTLDRLRSALQGLKPGAPIALQIQRDERLMFVSFVLEQP
jgi:serine protease Do